MATTPGDGVLQRLRRGLAASGHLDRIRYLPRHALERLDHPLRRLDSPIRRWVAVGVLLVLVMGAGVAASAGFGTATAENTELAGRPVPAGQVQVIAAAAHACPVLTPARLAGHLMVASAFDGRAKSENGGVGVAGLTDAAWDKWKPRQASRRTDPAANITALAHLTCDLAGQVRQAGIGGDPWRLALAAYHSGVEGVRAAKGIPPQAIGYVNRVAAYAAWYARLSGTGASPSGPAGPIGVVPSRGAAAKPVPDDYVASVLAAGRICPALPPARVAAQMMASSGFNPNMLGAHGAQGIAQFTPELWARYAPSAASASAWEPSTAIPVLGRTMCILLSEMGGLSKDSYPPALAAFRHGPEAVRQAGGVPDNAELRDYVSLVTGYVGYYAQDPRLGGIPASQPGTPTTPPRNTPPQPGTKPTTPAPPTSAAPPPAAGGQPGAGNSPSQPQQPRSPTAPPKPDWQSRVVEGTSVLQLGQAWTTNRLNFVLATDGNVLLYDQGRLVWQTRTGGKGARYLVFQADGNLVLYTQSYATVWTSGSAGNNGAILVLQADGNVTISLRGRGLWHTGTN